MADLDLRVDYQDDILDLSVNTKRKYNIIENADGTKSLEDVSVYTQKGDSFGAVDVNKTNQAVLDLNQSLTNYKGYGEAVALDNMTSESNPFTVPTNGVLCLRAEGTGSHIYAWVGTFVVGVSSNWQYGVNSIVVPVFKGMEIYETVKLGTNYISFIPFEK